MSAVSCSIWESCQHQATSECFYCENNDLAEDPKEDCYDFNHWDDTENDY